MKKNLLTFLSLLIISTTPLFAEGDYEIDENYIKVDCTFKSEKWSESTSKTVKPELYCLKVPSLVALKLGFGGKFNGYRLGIPRVFSAMRTLIGGDYGYRGFYVMDSMIKAANVTGIADEKNELLLDAYLSQYFSSMGKRAVKPLKKAIVESFTNYDMSKYLLIADPSQTIHLRNIHLKMYRQYLNEKSYSIGYFSRLINEHNAGTIDLGSDIYNIIVDDFLTGPFINMINVLEEHEYGDTILFNNIIGFLDHQYSPKKVLWHLVKANEFRSSDLLTKEIKNRTN